MNVQSHVVRGSGDVQAAARFGAAPWQVGVLAALLLVFEIFVGALSMAALQAKALQVQQLKQIALGDAAAHPDIAPPQERLLDMDALLIPYAPQDFASPQQGHADQAADEEDKEEVEAEAEEEAQELDQEMPPPAEEPAAEVPQANIAPLELKDVRSSDFGFGANGVTVRPDGLHSKVKYHNELMKACGLTLRELAAAMFKASEKQSERPALLRKEARTSGPPDQRTSSGPAADQQRTSSRPAADQQRTSSGPAADQQQTSSGPPADHQRTTSGPPADHQRTTSGPDNHTIMSPNKCTPLWCEAHLEVKSVKAQHSRSTF
eukprot:s5105_g4.t1